MHVLYHYVDESIKSKFKIAQQVIILRNVVYFPVVPPTNQALESEHTILTSIPFE